MARASVISRPFALSTHWHVACLSGHQKQSRRLQKEMEDTMRTTTTIIGIAAFALAGLSADAMARGRGPRGGSPGRGFAARGLSPQQKQQIRETASKQAEPLQAQMKTKLRELQQLWRADRPDRGAIVREHGEMNAIRDKQQSIWIDFRMQVHGVLTPEQRAKWAEHAGGGPGFGGGSGAGSGFSPRGFGNPDCPMRTQ
jgi:Spy/CpxP family protein refolding chaperone